MNNTNNRNNVNHLLKLIYDEENINSIFLYLFGIFKRYGINFKSKTLDSNFFEKLNDILSKISENDQIFLDSLDKQLLAFFEENKNSSSDDDLITDVVDNSLFSIQSNDKEPIVNLLKARWHFIKKSYNSSSYRNIYECGLTLQDFDLVDSNKKLLLNYIKQLNNWFEYTLNEQEELLFDIAKFISKFKIGSELSKNENYELILKYWIKRFNIDEIIRILDENYEIKMNEAKIVSIINECKYILPWGMTSILNYIYSNFTVKISDICYNIVDMFKFGVFDLKISILMPIFKDFSLCKELSEFIDVNSSIPDILFYLENLDAEMISENNRKKFISFRNSNDVKHDYFAFINFDTFDISENDKFIIKKFDDGFVFYNLGGEYLFEYSLDDCLNVDYYDEINNINKIWVVFKIDNLKIILV